VSDSAEMTVKYPQETLSVWLLPKHPVNERLADFKLTETSGITQGTIEDIILPYQGFELRWKPQSKPPLPAGAAPVENQEG
jgi:hypothetical protein